MLLSQQKKYLEVGIRNSMRELQFSREISINITCK